MNSPEQSFSSGAGFSLRSPWQLVPLIWRGAPGFSPQGEGFSEAVTS